MFFFERFEVGPEYGKRVFIGTENPHTWQVRGYYRTQSWYRDGYPNPKRGPHEIPDLTEKEIFTYDWTEEVNKTSPKQTFNSSYDNATVRLNVRQAIAQLRDIPFYAGSFRWTGHDYIGEAGFVHGGWPFKAFMGGVIDLANFEKDHYYLYQSQWTEEPMLHILPHWTHPVMKEGTEIPVWAYTNCDEVELFFNGKSLGRKAPGTKWDEIQCQWMVGWQPGELKAIAYKKGTAILEKTVRTAGAPAKNALTIDGEPLAATGKDWVQVRVSSQDKDGNFYPYGENRSYFHIIGPAEIDALDNGSPIDVEQHHGPNHRIGFFGLTRAYVKFVTLVGCFGFALVGCGGDSSKSATRSGEMVDHFADNAFGNAVAIVQHPAGEFRDGVTYVCYQGPLEDPYVASYNHESGEWTGPFKAGVSELGKDSNRMKKIDNHGKPTLIIDNAGYIHVFFGGHGGKPEHGENRLGNHHDGANKHVVSKHPFDITSWEELDTIPVFGTYNQAVKMSNGDIYLFYRHGAHRSDWVYQKSTDNGRSFAPPVSFLKHKRRDDLKAVDSWYAWVGRGEGDDIIVGYDYHLCWDVDAGIDSRGHTTERHDVYYMVFDTKTGAWRNVEGETLEMPIIREDAEEKTLAVSTGDLWTFNGSAHLDSKGYPHIGTNIGEDLGEKTGGPKQTSHFRWTGKEWVGGESIAKVESRGDFLVGTPEDVRFLLAYKEESGDGVVAWWNSTDGGAHFAKGEELLRREKASWAVTSMIRSAHPDARILVVEKKSGTDWGRVYLLGDKGPIKRFEEEAESFGGSGR